MTVFEEAARLPKRHPYLFLAASAALVVVLSLVIYARTFDYGYLDWDDNTLVEQNVYVMNHGDPRFPTANLWTPGRGGGSYQPIRTWSYIFDRDVLGKNTRGHEDKAKWHHFVNTILYIVNGLVLLWVLRKLLDPWTAAIATLIWVAHPVHVEAVAWVSGRKEMLSGIFMIAAFGLYVASAERSDRAAPRLRWMFLSAALVIAGIALAWMWPGLSLKWGMGTRSWQLGALAALVVSAGIVVGALDQRQRRWQVMALGVAAFLASVAGLLSKPVGVVLPPILLAWELGHRPVRAHVERWKGRTGLLVAIAGMLAVGSFAFGFFVWGRSTSAGLKAAVASTLGFAALAGGGIAAMRGASQELRTRMTELVDRVFPTTEEAIGMVCRSLPFVGLALWGLNITVVTGSEGSIIKAENWNAVPGVAQPSQLISAISSVWLDVYHLVAPLKLSALYYVEAKYWHLGTYLGAAVLLALPVVFAWMVFRAPKALVWFAWLVAPIIPVSGIIKIAAPHADRYLYLPAIAMAVAVAYLLSTAAFGRDEESGDWERWLAGALSIVIVIGFTALSFDRTGKWANDERLWGDAVSKNPQLPSARNNYGAALMNAATAAQRRGDQEMQTRKVQEALQQYYAAYEIQPTLDVAQFNIAATELRLQRPERAKRYADEFVAQHPEMPTGWILNGTIHQALARNLEKRGAPKEEVDAMRDLAAKAFESGCGTVVYVGFQLQVQDQAVACTKLASVHLAAGNTTGADLAWTKAVENAPNKYAIRIDQAKALRAHRQFERAYEAAQAAYQLRPHADAVRLLVQISIDQNRLTHALEWADMLSRARTPAPQDLLLRQRIQDAVKNGTPIDLSPAKLDELPPELQQHFRAPRGAGLPVAGDPGALGGMP